MTEISNPAIARAIATGTYTGNGGGRTITVGFECSAVIIIGVSGALPFALVTPDGSIALDAAAHHIGSVIMSATDGWDLLGTANEWDMNINTNTYRYWATGV